MDRLRAGPGCGSALRRRAEAPADAALLVSAGPGEPPHRARATHTNLRSNGIKSELRAPGSRLVLTLHPRPPCGQEGQLSCPFCCTISFRIIYLDLKKSNSLALLAFEPQLCDALCGAATAGEQSWIAGASVPIERNPVSAGNFLLDRAFRGQGPLHLAQCRLVNLGNTAFVHS